MFCCFRFDERRKQNRSSPFDWLNAANKMCRFSHSSDQIKYHRQIFFKENIREPTIIFMANLRVLWLWNSREERRRVFFCALFVYMFARFCRTEKYQRRHFIRIYFSVRHVCWARMRNNGCVSFAFRSNQFLWQILCDFLILSRINNRYFALGLPPPPPPCSSPLFSSFCWHNNSLSINKFLSSYVFAHMHIQKHK